ncbi:MAG: DUF4214 domain-containing protein [Pseudomonadota bacterium]
MPPMVYSGTADGTLIRFEAEVRVDGFQKTSISKTIFVGTVFNTIPWDCDTPSSITVPATDDDGSYTISWSPSTTSGVTYVLEEATDSGFTGELRTAYSGSSTSTSITGSTVGATYYYRVKATRSGYADSDWQKGSNGCAVGPVTDVITERQFIVAIYVAYWGRAADPEGVSYWLSLYQSGILNFAGIAENFANSDEGQTAYSYFDTVFNHSGSIITASMREDFIVAVYRNLFDREPDAEGLVYWAGILESGATTPGEFIATVINAAYEGRLDASADDWRNVNAKIRVAEYYTDKIIEKGINWTVNGNRQQAEDVLAGIDKNSDIDAAKRAIDEEFDPS